MRAAIKHIIKQIIFGRKTNRKKIEVEKNKFEYLAFEATNN